MEKAIETLRQAMHNLAEQYGVCDPRVIQKSQMLDKLILQYMTRSCGVSRQPSMQAPSDMSSLATGVDLESIFSLHEEITDLERSIVSSDPMLMRKCRELDKLLVAYIQR